MGNWLSSASFKKTHGFSLIELLVVITIIGLLAVISVPTFRNWKVKAARAEALTNLSAIAHMYAAYRVENGPFTESVNNTWNSDHAASWNSASDHALTRYSYNGANCAVENFLGYAISNCEESYYRYSIRVHSTGFRVLAVNNPFRPLSSWSAGDDVIVMCPGKDMRICQSVDATTGMTDPSCDDGSCAGE